MNQESKGMLIGFVGILIFSLTLPITKIAVQSFSPYFIAFGRAALAGMVAAIYLIATRSQLPSRSAFIKLVVIALGVVFGFPVFTTVAMTQGASSHGAVILGLLPLATTVIGVIRFQERPSLGFWVVSLIGAGLVMTYALIQGSGRFSYFDGLVAIGGLFACMGYVEGGHLSKKMNPVAVISWALVISLPINLAFASYFVRAEYFEAGQTAWVSFLYLSFFSMYAGFFFWYRGLAMGGNARVSQVLLLQPFCTLVASSILLTDPLTSINVVFAALVVLTVIIGKKMVVN
jgi:drug/metabolite transporter (DMT)-like permease